MVDRISYIWSNSERRDNGEAARNAVIPAKQARGVAWYMTKTISM